MATLEYIRIAPERSFNFLISNAQATPGFESLVTESNRGIRNGSKDRLLSRSNGRNICIKTKYGENKKGGTRDKRV